MEATRREDLRVVNAEEYGSDVERFELRCGAEEGAPSCPYGNTYAWVGYDRKAEEYVRLTKSVFKRLINNQ